MYVNDNSFHYDKTNKVVNSTLVLSDKVDRNAPEVNGEKIIYSEVGLKSWGKDVGGKASDISESKALHEINCFTRESRDTNAIVFNSSGEIVFNESDKTKNWRSISPESSIGISVEGSFLLA